MLDVNIEKVIKKLGDSKWESILRCKHCNVLWVIWPPSRATPEGSMSLNSPDETAPFSCKLCEYSGYGNDSVFEMVAPIEHFDGVSDWSWDAKLDFSESKE